MLDYANDSRISATRRTIKRVTIYLGVPIALFSILGIGFGLRRVASLTNYDDALARLKQKQLDTIKDGHLYNIDKSYIARWKQPLHGGFVEGVGELIDNCINFSQKVSPLKIDFRCVSLTSKQEFKEIYPFVVEANEKDIRSGNAVNSKMARICIEKFYEPPEDFHLNKGHMELQINPKSP